MLTYNIKGISDEQTECDCCGRKGLKRTVALEVLENGDSTQEIIRVGVDCASVLMSRTNRPKSARQIKLEAQSIVTKEQEARARFEKDLSWKVTNRISARMEDAAKAYQAQFRSYDYRDQDHGDLLTNGEAYVIIPSAKTLESLSANSAERAFVQLVEGKGFKAPGVF